MKGLSCDRYWSSQMRWPCSAGERTANPISISNKQRNQSARRYRGRFDRRKIAAEVCARFFFGVGRSIPGLTSGIVETGIGMLLSIKFGSVLSLGKGRFRHKRTMSLRPSRVGRPELRRRDIGQSIESVCRYRRQAIDNLISVSVTKHIRAGVIKGGVLFDVVRPIADVDCGPGGSTSLDRILVHCAVDHAQIIEDLSGLRAFTGSEKAGHGNRSEERDDRDDDHDFHERKASSFR